jgi:signal peptidase I
VTALRKFFAKNASWLAVLLGILTFRSSIAEPYVVPTGSMEPTILPGDYLIVLKSAYDLRIPFTDHSLLHTGVPERGDVIVFKYPVDPSIDFVKRLIGLPGDQIAVTDGQIQVNGKRLAISHEQKDALMRTLYEEKIGTREHWVQRLPHAPDQRTLTFEVPQGQYFFMGDNRDNSNDSRFWGFVPRGYLRGKALGIWFSLDHHHTIPEPRWDRIGNALWAS